ncbi:hypothetical protein PFISCL1PPCAC_21598, partial [Pristionchus fissidentatus]
CFDVLSMRRAVCVLLLGCYAVFVCGSSPTTTPTPTLTTAAAADPQKAFHCSDRPTSKCGSRVLKCQLMKACNCTMTSADLVTQSCACCKECIACLGPYLTECCACVGLCELSPLADDAEEEAEDDGTEYEIEHFDVVREALGLFEKTFAPMVKQQWQMYVYSIVDEPGPLGSRLEKDVARSLAAPADNCTVVYLDECISRKACSQKCKVLMATSFRWFVTGCCECAGTHCLEGGSVEPRCNKCHLEDFPHIDEDEEEVVLGSIHRDQLKEL